MGVEMNAKNDLILILFMRKIFLLLILSLITLLTPGCIENIYWGNEIENVTFSTDYLVVADCGSGLMSWGCNEYLLFGYNQKAYIIDIGSFSAEKFPCEPEARPVCGSECYGPNKSEEKCEKCVEECEKNPPKIIRPSDKLEKMNDHKITLIGKYNKRNNSLFNFISVEVCLLNYNITDCRISNEFDVNVDNVSICKNCKKQAECYEAFALAEDNPKYCREIYTSMDEYCYQKLALKLKDENICNFSRGGYIYRNSCFEKVAILKKDLKVCEKMVDLDYEEYCNNYYSPFIDKNQCLEKLKGIMLKEKDRCIERVSVVIAISKRNVSSCKSLTTGRYDCITQIAEDTENAEICEELNKSYDKDICYERVALKLKDAKYCDYISDISSHAECIVKIAISKKDKQLCERLLDVKYSEKVRNDCLSYHREEVRNECLSYYGKEVRNNCLKYVDNVNKVDFFCEANDIMCLSAFMK